MKILTVISVISATFLLGYAQEKPSASEDKIIPFDAFYRQSYGKIMNSDEIVVFIKKCIQSDKRTESEQLFYSSGFIRGIFEMSTLENYKQAPGEGLYNMRGKGANAIAEQSGWKEGCSIGQKIGDKILEAYGDYLQQDEQDREKISVSDIHIDLPHIEKDMNKAQMTTPKKPSD